jgi:hypothetical protein
MATNAVSLSKVAVVDSRMGFISVALLIYKSRQRTRNYHSDIGIKTYESWLKLLIRDFCYSLKTSVGQTNC